ncbi:MAG: acyl-CoA thioesterase [Bacteroidales bacterium]|nr:acyl-CoA thioesterase [Bacteroidales bacterium]
MENERKMYIEMPIQVHSYDVDFMQIVNNTVYVKWLEDMRMAILDKYLPLTELLKESKSPILSETKVQYKLPVTLESHPVGKCWVWLTGPSRWMAEFVIEEEGRVFATAQQSGCIFNVERRRPAPFPDAIIEQYLERKE